MTGLNLLHLLADNRIAEFHTELELISQKVCRSHASFGRAAYQRDTSAMAPSVFAPL